MQRLALVERQCARKVVAPLLDQVGDAFERGGALERGSRRPVAAGRVGRGDRSLRVLSRALRDGAERLARGRTRGLEALPGL